MSSEISNALAVTGTNELAIRQLLALKRPRVYSILNVKGGCGKTITTFNLGAALAMMGWKVLLFDIDLQGGLTSHFNLDPNPAFTSAAVLSRAVGLEECILPLRDNLYIVPATNAVEAAERSLTGASGGEVRLRNAFKHADLDFDFIFIDCPSGWGPVTRNAVLASQGMIVPINSEPAAITLAVSTIAEAQELAEYHDHNIDLMGVLLTRYRGTNSARTVEASALKIWDDMVFSTRIRQTERINELAFHSATTSDGKHGYASEDHESLAKEFLARIK
jgi:chromosome partitioning protein